MQEEGQDDQERQEHQDLDDQLNATLRTNKENQSKKQMNCGKENN